MPYWKNHIDIKRHFIQDRDPTSAETTEVAIRLIAEINKVIDKAKDSELEEELRSIRDDLEMIGPEDSDEDAMDNLNYLLDVLYDIGNFNHRIWIG